MRHDDDDGLSIAGGGPGRGEDGSARAARPFTRRAVLGGAAAAPFGVACAGAMPAAGTAAAPGAGGEGRAGEAPADLPPLAPATGRIRLLVRGDDMGSTHGANMGCVRAAREGLVRSVEVIVPGPWFPEAVRLLERHAEIDVGVHLCLTSEWENARWRPLTRAPSLVDADGFFFPMTRQRAGFPPNTGFLDARPRLEEVEAELRAQIELLRRRVPRLSHASSHMGAATATPELRALTNRLLAEYGLMSEGLTLRRFELPPRPRDGGGDRAAGTERRLVAALGAVGPGDYMLVQHPATDDPEMRAIGHLGYYDVAADRAAETAALTSPRAREVVRRRGIELIDHRALRP
jgi:hypothetical protein